MKIGIDARFLTHPQLGGFKTYTEQLIGALAEVDAENEYVLYIDRTPTPDIHLPAHHNFSHRIVTGSVPMLGMPWREQVGLAVCALRDRLDLLHSPCLTAPLRLACPSVVTIHDTIWLWPKHFARRGKVSGRRTLMQWYYQLISRFAARRAAAIITVSHASKEAIVRDLHIPSERVWVTYEAAGPMYSPLRDQAHIATALRRHGLASSFILAIGSADPRKNIAGLLQAYALLPAHLQEHYTLAIVWTHSYLAPELAEQAAALGITHQLRFLEHVSNEDLAVLYSAASTFVFPSLYEGFGLPLLEAMSCGTPVIAADNSSIPEITGDAAVLVAAEDVSMMAEAIARVLTDATLNRRMATLGPQRAATFSWTRCAQQTVEVYRKTGIGQGLSVKAGATQPPIR